MSDNAELGAQLAITYDQAAAEATAQALKDAKAQTEALAKTNLLAADTEREAAEAEKAMAAAAEKAAAAARAQAAATKSVSDVMKEIERQKAIDQLAIKWANVAKETKNAGAAQAELQKELLAMKASQTEIAGAASTFAAGTDVGASLGSRITRAGQELRALPSTRLPGIGIGTDAIANILRVGGAITDKLLPATAAQTAAANAQAAATAAVTGASSQATPSLLASAAAFAAVAIPLVAITAVVIAVGAAVKGAVDEIQNNLARLEKELDARRSALEAAGSGTTTEEARKKIDEYNRTIETQNKLLDENKGLQGQSFEQLQAAKNQSFGFLGDLAARVTVAFNASAVTKYGDQITESNEKLADAEAGAKEWQKALDEGAFAANDAAEAEARLAEERTKATLESAAAAGREVDARNRADKASFEQNQARLQAIEDEKESIAAQLAVLQSSGDTSEEVADQIAKLNGQLGALGKESDYISSTALAASKARDDAKKALKEAEKAQEEAQRKQEQAAQKRLQAAETYSNKLVDIARQAADKADDLLTDLTDKFAANEVDFGRDIDQLSVKANQTRLEDQIKAQAEEAADLREHQRKLEAIRDEGISSEEELLSKRNFLEAAKVREQVVARLEAENKAFEEGQSEKQIAEAEARAKEDRELDFARQQRFQALQEQNADARTAYELARRDAGIARERAEREAAINRDRDIKNADDVANSVLQIKQQQGAAEIQIAQQTLAGITAMAAGMTAPQTNYAAQSGSTTNINSNSNSIGSLSFPINGANNPANVQQVVIATLGQLGFVN